MFGTAGSGRPAIIKLDDPNLAADLLGDTRDGDCIAYLVETGDATEAIDPHAFGEAEQRSLRSLLDRSGSAHPDVRLKLTEQ